MTDLKEIVDALLFDEEWYTEWFGSELITRAIPGKSTPYSCLGIVEGGPPKPTDAKKQIIASSPVWLATVIVGWVEETKRWKEHITEGRCIGPCAEVEALRDFNITGEKYAELRGRLESSLQKG